MVVRVAEIASDSCLLRMVGQILQRTVQTRPGPGSQQIVLNDDVLVVVQTHKRQQPSHAGMGYSRCATVGTILARAC